MVKLFSDLNSLDELNKARAAAIMTAGSLSRDRINAAYQARKRLILEKEKAGQAYRLTEISVHTAVSCDAAKPFGARFENQTLTVNLPVFAMAAEASSNQIPLPLHPKEPNTFALYFMENENLPLFIVT